MVTDVLPPAAVGTEETKMNRAEFSTFLLNDYWEEYEDSHADGRILPRPPAQGSVAYAWAIYCDLCQFNLRPSIASTEGGGVGVSVEGNAKSASFFCANDGTVFWTASDLPRTVALILPDKDEVKDAIRRTTRLFGTTVSGYPESR
jgi:hypothetical protein